MRIGRDTGAHIIRRSVRRPLALLSLALLLLPGCGGDDGGGGGSATIAEGRPVALTALEYRFEPTNVTLQGASGPVRIELENKGSLAHDVRVLDGDRDVGGTPAFPGGERRSARVALEPGSYRMICSVGNHEELGMTGELVVR